MEQINNAEPVKITVKGPFTFSVGDTTKFGDYISGGIFTQVKMPKIISFVSQILFLVRTASDFCDEEIFARIAPNT